MYILDTRYGKIMLENSDTLIALIGVLDDARDWNVTNNYDACAKENKKWIKALYDMLKSEANNA